MNEQPLRLLIEALRQGRLSRRAFVTRMAALGLGAPMASMLLLHEGIAQAPSAPAYKPTRRGSGGLLKVLWWQAPTLLNPHFANGSKDLEASRIFYEPLAVWDHEGQLVPVLAAQVPNRADGTLAADGRSVVWRLKKDVKWHDGRPFTADDCVFTWQYARDPATAATTAGTYKDVQVEKIDTHAVRVRFERPTPFWATAFVGGRGMVIPKHVFGPYAGAASREAPANLKPVGTGPYKFAAFRPGDLVRGEINTDYHLPHRPHFDAIEMKGGGDAVSAARAVLQTGEYDYAWGLQVEDDVLQRMEAGGKGRVNIVKSGDVEFVQLNFTDPFTEVDGERASLKSRHFAFSDPAVRQAMALLADRKGMEEFIYGRAGVATPNFLNSPPRFRSPNTHWEFSIDKAAELLEAAGWKRGADGVREKDGRRLKLVFQTSINTARQKVQTVFKQACQKAGIELELKSVTASVFFSSDFGNPDTFSKFWADLQMFSFPMTQPDPERLMDQYTSWEVSSKANKWQGRNITRWTSEQYDRLYREAAAELDPVKRAALFIRMNDLVINEHVVVPLVNRFRVSAAGLRLATVLSSWDLDFAQLHHWYRDNAA
jgi:peptide/nickel transport system substrate-binding protein